MTYPRPSAGASFGAAAVVPSPRFPDIEQDTLAFWRADDTFRASIANRDGADEWVFYDGPPFANGLPHYGHLLTGYAKDLFPRFQTMRGKKVDRVFGWDTHGLPAELEAMRLRMLDLRKDLAESLRRATNSDRFDFVAAHRGMFSRLGATPEQVAALRKDHGIYMVGDSRVNIAGLPAAEGLDKMARALVDVGA